MTRGAPGADSKIRRHRRAHALVAEQLPRGLKVSWLRVQNDFGAQMPEFVRREFQTGAFSKISSDQPRDGLLIFYGAISLHE
jgi:hypothetical protein